MHMIIESLKDYVHNIVSISRKQPPNYPIPIPCLNLYIYDAIIFKLNHLYTRFFSSFLLGKVTLARLYSLFNFDFQNYGPFVHDILMAHLNR